MLIAFSVPPLRSRGIRARVEPYLDGLGGRSYGSVVAASMHAPPWVVRGLSAAGLLNRSELRMRLDAAGRVPDEIAFRIEQLSWAVGAFVVTIGLGVVSGTGGPYLLSLPTLAVACIAGACSFLARDWYLTKEIDVRHRALKEQLPTALDHLTLALMAGESIARAVQRVAETATGVVAEEFERVSGDIRAGATVVDALDKFRTRVPDASIERFVDALCVSIERGTSLADVLRAQADDAREAKRRYLLELGGRREVLMLIPVVFLIMPVVVLFALYPGLVSLDLLVP